MCGEKRSKRSHKPSCKPKKERTEDRGAGCGLGKGRSHTLRKVVLEGQGLEKAHRELTTARTRGPQAWLRRSQGLLEQAAVKEVGQGQKREVEA